jgi:dipeptidase
MIDRHEEMPSTYAQSCDTAVLLGDLTGGGVLLAKNSDRSSHEAQRLIGVLGDRHAPGDIVQCQYISVPQAPSTAALIGSQPYWLWGFEHGMNEHGVAIGNEAIITREPPRETGLLGMDLVRLGLERGTTARGALEAITGLLELFGQGGSAAHHALRYYDNSFLIADPHEAWVLETCGRHWVARHLTSGGYSISNRATIGSDYDLASAGLVAYAEERGWWPRGRRPFDFAEACADPHNPGLPSATCRMGRSRAHVQGAGPRTVEGMMALLRDHGAHPTSADAWLPWPTGQEPATVCVHGPAEGGSTAASMVARLLPGAPPTYWASMGPPCTAVFVPCWVDGGPLAVLAHADERPHDASPWWRYRRVWEAVAASPDPGALVERIRAAWAPLEEEMRGRVVALDETAPAAERRRLSEECCAAALDRLAELESEAGVRVAAGMG